MTDRIHHRRRIFSALACLLAVVFLYAPLAGAAWSSHAMACCTGGYCNILNHHHQKAPANSSASEDCGHRMALMNCSMSCCPDPDKPVVTSVAFVLPPATFTPSSILVTRTVERTRSIGIPRSVEPLSRPPRIGYTAL